MTYDWPTERDRAIRAFRGELPHPHTEQAILDAFTVYPLVVVRAIGEVADAIASGKPGAPRSGWAVLRKRLAQTAPASEVRVEDSSDRERTVAVAERWIRTVGIHFDREEELLEELYSLSGFVSGMTRSVTLAPWAADVALRERMVSLWRQAVAAECPA